MIWLYEKYLIILLIAIFIGICSVIKYLANQTESLMSSSHKKLSLFQYSYINHSFSKKDMYVAFKKENVKKKIL